MFHHDSFSAKRENSSSIELCSLYNLYFYLNYIFFRTQNLNTMRVFCCELKIFGETWLIQKFPPQNNLKHTSHWHYLWYQPVSKYYIKSLSEAPKNIFGKEWISLKLKCSDGYPNYLGESLWVTQLYTIISNYFILSMLSRFWN